MDVQDFGGRLFRAVFAGGVGTCLLRSLDEARRRGTGLRVRLRFDEGLAELADLPWEYLYVGDERRFLALSDVTPVVRYLEVGHAPPPLLASAPLIVLVVLSSPADVAPLDVQREWDLLLQATDVLAQRQRLRLERLPAATLAALQTRLRQGPVHVLHFVGHGFFDAGQNLGGMVFEDARGNADAVPARTLGVLLADHAALRLVFLNVCQGAASGRSDSFVGVAQSLVQGGIPAVVAMQFPVSDGAAIALAQEFYRSLADGYPVEAALSEARKAIVARGNTFEWGTPVLFSRSDDNRLISPPDEAARPAGAQITITQRVNTNQGDVTGVKVDTIQGPVSFQGPVTLNLTNLPAALAELRPTAGPAPDDLSQPVIKIKPFEPETMLIPGGPFLMGTDDPAAPAWERPQHTVDLPDFRIGKHPVTSREYAEFLRRNRGHSEPPRAGWFLPRATQGQARPSRR